MNKLVKIDSEGNVHEVYSEYFVNLPINHATKIPIDHPDDSIITSKLVDSVVTTPKIMNLNVTAEKLNNNLNLQGKIALVDTPVLGIENEQII